MFGDGSDGPLNVTSGTTQLAPNVKHQFTTVSVGPSGTIIPTAVAGSVLYITATQSINIDGIINTLGRAPVGNNSWSVTINGTTYSSPGVANGGKGGDALNGGTGGNQGSGFGGGGAGGGWGSGEGSFRGGHGGAGGAVGGSGGSSVSRSTTGSSTGNNGGVSAGGSGGVFVLSGSRSSGAGGSAYGSDGGSGAGESGSTAGNSGGGGGAGGSAGRAGLHVVLSAPSITVNGTIVTSGTNGQNGGAGGANAFASASRGSGGGGGGGGNAGKVYIFTNDLEQSTATYTLNGGAGGTGGSGYQNGTNGQTGTDGTVVEAPVVATFPNGYMYRKKITAKSGYLSTNSFSGPMVVQGIFPELKAIPLGGRVYNTQDYHDILFTNENNVPLNWGIEAYNSNTGNLVAWVHPGGGKMLSSGSEGNRSIYMYYGKPVMENRTTNMAAVWSGYDFSLLMNGSQGGGNEYTYPQNEWFAPENANWETVSGAHGLARKFSGGGIYKNYEARYDLHRGVTLAMQVRFNSLPSSEQNIPLYQIVGQGAFRYDNVSGTRRLNLVKYGVVDQYVTASLNAGQWYHLTCVVDTSETRYYVNGAHVGSFANSSNFNPRMDGKYPSIMWPDGGGQVRLNVDIDTMNMVSNARPAWAITVEYNNQNRSDFWDIGAEEVSALVIESAGHGFSSDDVTLIENSTLALDNALNGHLSQVVALIYHDVISTPNASSHSLTSQIGALVRNISLAMNSSTHGLTSDQVTVSFGHLLEMIDSVHTLSSTQVKLSQAQLIAIASTLHTIAGQTPLVTENKTLKNIGNTLHTTKSDMIKLLENYILAVESLIHGHESEQVVLLQSSLLEINNALHGLNSNIVDILEYTLLGKPHDAKHTVVSVNVGLVHEHILAVENALNVLKSDEGRIINWDTLGVGFGLYRSEYIHSGRLTGRNIQGYVQTDTYIPEYKQLGRLGLPKDEPTGRFVQKNITRGAL